MQPRRRPAGRCGGYTGRWRGAITPARSGAAPRPIVDGSTSTVWSAHSPVTPINAPAQLSSCVQTTCNGAASPHRPERRAGRPDGRRPPPCSSCSHPPVVGDDAVPRPALFKPTWPAGQRISPTPAPATLFVCCSSSGPGRARDNEPT